MSLNGNAQALDALQARELERASWLLQSGGANDALLIAQRLAGQAASAPDAHHFLALCHAQLGDVPEAEKAFLLALELAREHPMILVNYAVMLRTSGRLEAAIGLLRRATDAAPAFAKAWSELGVTALRVSDHREARLAFKHAAQLQPDSVQAWMALGDASRIAGDLDAAEAAFTQALILQPAHQKASINLGAILRLSGRADKAITCFQRIQKSAETSPELADALAGALLDDGRLDDALHLSMQIVRTHPDFVAGRVTLANLLWEYGSAAASGEDSFEVFRSALVHAPDHHDMRAAFIQFLLSARRSDEALLQIRSLRAHADDPMLAWMEANALEMLGRTEQAGALYAKLHAEWGSGVPAFLNSHARHLMTAGKWDAAARVASHATLLEPGNQEAWANLAIAWRLLDDPREHWLCDYDHLVTLIDIEPPREFDTQSDFLEALAANLDQRHKARREPIQQSLRGGSQTPGRLFGGPDPLLASARTALMHGIERWLATLPTDAAHPFLMRKTRSVRMGGSWSVKLWSAGNHVNHVHPEGWISSAFYVSLPPSVLNAAASGHVGNQAGYLQLGQPPVELRLGLLPRRVIRPEPGKLALFPSYMWHGTVPFEDVLPRLTVAFDMTPLEDLA